jgi:hypothetical protein
MQKVNKEIKAYNATVPKGVRKRRRRKRTPCIEFKHVEFKRDYEKGGLDYV